MIINIDSIFTPDWTEQLGNRIFPFEAFISHNREDKSIDFAESLRSLNVQVWHDGDADLRDRKVRQKVSKAIRASRYLILFVPRAFRDSVWVKAEYMPELVTGQRAKTTRVLVVTADNDAPVPERLRDCPHFSLCNLTALAAYLRHGNQVPFITRVLADASHYPLSLERNQLMNLVAISNDKYN